MIMQNNYIWMTTSCKWFPTIQIAGIHSHSVDFQDFISVKLGYNQRDWAWRDNAKHVKRTVTDYEIGRFGHLRRQKNRNAVSVIEKNGMVCILWYYDKRTEIPDLPDLPDLQSLLG